ncbi:deoxycytidylate deaminase [Gautieria morchelliformis]|nr:deoxycytidylate deaminase [Gautieria morchelliformis]
MAALASQRSNCMKRRVGAILVSDKRVVATGLLKIHQYYNGTPRNVRNCNEGGCPRCNNGGRSGESLESCLCLHAEENALLEAGRERVGAGSVLYCNTLVQTGVRGVVYNLSYKVDDQSAALFNQAGVILRQHSPPQ